MIFKNIATSLLHSNYFAQSPHHILQYYYHHQNISQLNRNLKKLFTFQIHFNYITRLLIASYLSKYYPTTVYQDYAQLDVVQTKSLESFGVDMTMIALVSAFFVIFAYSTDYLFTKIGVDSIEIYYNLMITNKINLNKNNSWLGEAIWEIKRCCLRGKFSEARKCLSKLSNRLDLFDHLLRLKTPPLGPFPTMSAKCRVKVWLFSEILDRFCYSIVVFGSFILTILITIAIQNVLSPLPLHRYLLGLVDYLNLFYIAWNAIRITLCGLACIATTTYATVEHIKSIDAKLIRCYISRQSTPSLMASSIKMLQREFHHALLMAIRINISTAADSLSSALITTLACNIWMVTLLVYWQLGLGTQAIFILILIPQISIMLTFSGLYITWADSLYASTEVLFRMQMRLRRDQMGAKWRIMTLYEMMNSRKRFKFSVTGLAGGLSKWAIVEFFLAYTIYLLNAFAMAKKRFLIY